MQTKVVMGIDPGLANTGWGVVEQRGSKLSALAYGCITTDAQQDLAYRLAVIHDEVCAAFERYAPDALSIESIYFGANAKSAVATAQARGAVLVAAGKRLLEVGEYTPMQIKQVVVGTGAAEKEQVQYMVKAVLGLDHEPRPDHAADALAAAICHTRLGDMPQDAGGLTRQKKHPESIRSAWEQVAQEAASRKARA